MKRCPICCEKMIRNNSIGKSIIMENCDKCCLHYNVRTQLWDWCKTDIEGLTTREIEQLARLKAFL